MPPADDCTPSTTSNIMFKCDCSHNDGLPCYTAFNPDDLRDARLKYCMPWMTKVERDVAVLAKIECGIHMEEETTRTRHSSSEINKDRLLFSWKNYLQGYLFPLAQHREKPVL